MYQICVARSFIAQHKLVGGDWGSENVPHSHPYRLELIVEGPELDAHGYLADISVIDRALDEIVSQYRDAMLNDRPEFEGLNPSVEHFARLVCLQFLEKTRLGSIGSATVRVWEHDDAWGSYTKVL